MTATIPLPVTIGNAVSTPLRRAAASRTLQLFLIGGLIFLLFFYWRYANIPDELYQTRDDGVITMSHARNLVEYGFIGVNPSGGRVEGYSAPVQFWAYAAAYALTGADYHTFAATQTAICTFLLGAIFILFFRENRRWAILITALAALLLSWHYSFISWHGSGMENAITHVLFLAAALILFNFARRRRIVYPWAIIVFLASISRIDSIYYIAPILVIFSLYWWLTSSGVRQRIKGCYFSLTVIVLWLAYNLWRYVYFGDLTPNTAYAQGIEAIGWLERIREYGWGAVTLYAESYLVIFIRQGANILPLALPLLYFAPPSRPSLLMFTIIGCIIVTGGLSPFFFGDARIDVSRTTNHMAVFVALCLGLIIYQIKDYRIKTRKPLLIMTSAMMVLGAIAFNIYEIDHYELCCPTSEFDLTRQQFDRLAEQEQLHRPTVANPDLGVVSWHKHFNIIDLGRIGSPVISKLYDPVLNLRLRWENWRRVPPFISMLPRLDSNYFFDYAAPDFIEIHASSWTCRYYQSLLFHPKFDRHYHTISPIEFVPDSCRPLNKKAPGFWIRADIMRTSESPERKLIDTLSNNLSTDALRQELASCQSAAGNNCVYIARTAYRFLPEFRNAGLIDELNQIFSASRTKDYDLYLINGYRDGQAHQKAIEFIVNNWIAKVRQDEPIIRSAYEVFIYDNTLLYLKSGCRESDVEARFFLHLFPADAGDLAEGRDQYGFNNFGFEFDDYGIRVGGHCFAERRLPEYASNRIRTGQYLEDEKLWQGEFQIER